MRPRYSVYHHYVDDEVFRAFILQAAWRTIAVGMKNKRTFTAMVIGDNVILEYQTMQELKAAIQERLVDLDKTTKDFELTKAA